MGLALRGRLRTAEVDAAFKAERLLEPGSPAVPLRQGEAWLPYDSARAVALWLDALSRRQRMDRRAGVEPAASVGFYRDLIARATRWPAVQRGLLSAANDRPALAVVWLESVRPELAGEQLERLSRDADFLRPLDADERQRFLLAWYAAGDHEKLAQFIAGHEDWQEAAWPVQLRQWVATQEFERAVHEATDHYQVSLALPAPTRSGEPAGRLEEETADPVVAFRAY